MTGTQILFGLVLLGAGYLLMRTQRRMDGQFAALPPDAQWRMRTLFPAVMGLILVLFFVVIYLLRSHA